MWISKLFNDTFYTIKWKKTDLGMACIKFTIATKQKEVDAAIQILKSNLKNLKQLIRISMVPQMQAPSPQITRPTYVLLCDESRCVVIELSSLNVIPKSLYEFISLSRFTFVGFEITETIAPKLEKFGLVCKHVLEAGPSFPEMFSRLLSLRQGARNVSDTNEVSPSVVSISKACAAFYVGIKDSREIYPLSASKQVTYIGSAMILHV